MGEHDIGLVLFILVVYVWGFCCGWAWHRLSLRDRLVSSGRRPGADVVAAITWLPAVNLGGD